MDLEKPRSSRQHDSSPIVPYEPGPYATPAVFSGLALRNSSEDRQSPSEMNNAPRADSSVDLSSDGGSNLLQEQDECALCHYILNADNQLPVKRCPGCKNLFHSSCLSTWADIVTESICPLCRCIDTSRFRNWEIPGRSSKIAKLDYARPSRAAPSAGTSSSADFTKEKEEEHSRSGRRKVEPRRDASWRNKRVDGYVDWGDGSLEAEQRNNGRGATGAEYQDTWVQDADSLHWLTEGPKRTEEQKKAYIASRLTNGRPSYVDPELDSPDPKSSRSHASKLFPRDQPSRLRAPRQGVYSPQPSFAAEIAWRT